MATTVIAKDARPWWANDPTLRVWNFTGTGAGAVPVSSATERYAVIGYSLAPADPTQPAVGTVTAGGPGPDPATFLNTYFRGVAPAQVDSPGAGPAVDFLTVGNRVMAVLMLGATTGGAAVGVTFEQSHDGASWVAVPDAGVPAVGVAGEVSGTSFVRSRRYVRCQYDVTGDEGATANFSVLLFTAPDPSLDADNSTTLFTCNGSQTLPTGSVHITTDPNRGIYVNNLRGWIATVRTRG